MADDSKTALQYSTTEGYLPLRKFIVARYSAKYGFETDPENILILNGRSRVWILLDRGDRIPK